MNSLINAFNCKLYKFRGTHAVGSLQAFEQPCIGYINSGKAQFLYKGKSYYANKGNLIYIAKGTKYYSVWTGNPEIEFYYVKLSFINPYSFYDYRFQIIENYSCDLIDKLYRSYNDDIYLSASYLYCLLSDIYKHMRKEKSSSIGRVDVQPAVDFIEGNYNMPLSVEQLSKLCHSCSSGFYKLFKSSTGVTPIKYKHNIMIQNALELLSHTDLTVEEISARVGFSSSNYFRRVFFNITGKTPKELR